MPQPDAISFFFILFLTATVLLSLLCYGFSRSITFFSGLRFGLFWFVLVAVMLVMNQAARETLDPSCWSTEQLFVPVAQNTTPDTDKLVRNLLFGWLFFPVRTISQVQVHTEEVLTGVVLFLITGIVLEISGRTLVFSWRSRWTTMILLVFLLLDLMTYSAIGFIRQVAWILLS